jgi:hypothetical protein
MGLLLPVERHYQPEEYPIAFKKVAVNAPNNHWQMDITYVTLFPRIIFVLGIEEFVELHEFAGYGSFFKKLDEFMREYNWMRPHQSLGYMTPSKFYEEILRNNASRGVLVV